MYSKAILNAVLQIMMSCTSTPAHSHSQTEGDMCFTCAQTAGTSTNADAKDTINMPSNPCS
jgi:hypothetical protein